MKEILVMEHTMFAQANNEKATYTFQKKIQPKLLIMLFNEDKSLAIGVINID